MAGNLPDGVSPSDAHFAGPTPEMVEQETRREELDDYLNAIQDAEIELETLADSLTYLDGNFPYKYRETIAKRGYSFFLLKNGSGFTFLATAINSLKTSLQGLRERVEDLG